MKLKLSVIILLFFIFIAIAAVYLLQPPKAIKDLNHQFELTAENLLNEFNLNPAVAEIEYLGKVILLKGIITEKNDSLNYIMNERINISLEHFNNSKSLELNKIATVKGIFLGYDELFDELKLNQCIILE